MVIDTSAVVAILAAEPGADRLVRAIEAESVRLMSAATVVECSLVLLGRYGEEGEAQLDRFLRATGTEVVPVGEEQVELARHAALAFGRGRHSAGSNYGDCFSYALAVVRDEPLLFVGDDFSQTDVRVSGWRS
jgi:ribonuclease VapC